MLMTLVLPGSAQLAAGNRRTGRIALRTFLGLVAAVVLVVVVGLLDGSFVFWLLSNTFFLGLVRFLLMVLAVGWAYLFVDAWRLGDPLRLAQKQRLAVVGINGVLCFSVAGRCCSPPTSWAFRRTSSARCSPTARERGHRRPLQRAAARGRLRRRPLGPAARQSVGGQHRRETGRTVLFGLPRNMLNFPFPKGSIMHEQFPDGYDCGGQCELNSLATWAGDHKALFKGVANPGVEATKEGVEGVTGLKINYYAMVNLQGFQNLVDAVGGVTLNVRDRIPIGGVGAPITGYVPAGKRKLNGFQTLWFARSRVAADDYSRMARQKCVMNAMLHQLSPQTVVLKFEKIAKASEALITTDLPQGEVDRFMQLAMKARTQPVRTVSFVPPMINTSEPDIAKIHRTVERAITRSEGGGAAAGRSRPRRRPRARPARRAARPPAPAAPVGPSPRPAGRSARCARGTPRTSPTTSPAPAESTCVGCPACQPAPRRRRRRHLEQACPAPGVARGAGRADPPARDGRRGRQRLRRRHRRGAGAADR